MSSGLDQCLCEWWRATAALQVLVPVDRVAAEVRQGNEATSGDNDQDGQFDDCVVFQVASEPHWRTNSTQGWKSEVKLSALSAEYDQSKAIAVAIKAAWNNGTHTGSGSTITLARCTGLTPAQDEASGIWDHTVSFTINHTGV